MDSHTLRSPEETWAWGKQLTRILRVGDVIALVGELGSGKTTLVQGLAAGWGCRRRAMSPTFALVNEYRSPRGAFFHMDMYRLTPRELEAFPLEEYLDQRALCVIEWADRVRERLPADTLEIDLEGIESPRRSLRIVHPSKFWQKRFQALS